MESKSCWRVLFLYLSPRSSLLLLTLSMVMPYAFSTPEISGVVVTPLEFVAIDLAEH